MLLFASLGLFAQSGEPKVLTIKMNDSTRKILFYKHMEFSINNKRTDQFGFEFVKDDESIGVKSLIVDSCFLYLTDAYHSNIKRINVTSSQMESSDGVSDTKLKNVRWFDKLVAFKDLIYVPAYDTLYVFDKIMSLKKAIKAKRCRKYIYSCNDNELNIYLGEAQLKDFSTNFELLSINNSGVPISKIENVSIGVVDSSLNYKWACGRPYLMVSRAGKNYFQCAYGTIELKYPFVPFEDKFNASNDLFFDAHNLAYFYSTPSRIDIYVYKW